MAFLHILGIILKVLGFTVLGVLGLVLLLLLFLLLIPIGADFEYIGGEYKLSAKACGILIQLLPKKEKKEGKPKEKKERKKKEKKPKKEKEGEEEKPKEKKALDLTKEEIFELIKIVLGSLKKFGQLTVDRFLLHYTAAGKDPADTAKTLAYVNASLCALEPICSQQFRVKDYDVWTDCDFTTDRMKLDVALCITLRLWHAAALAVRTRRRLGGLRRARHPAAAQAQEEKREKARGQKRGRRYKDGRIKRKYTGNRGKE